MTARDLDGARDELQRRRRRAIESGALAIVAGCLAAALWPLTQPLWIALVVGAVVEVGVAALSLGTRRFEIQRLALDPDAYVLPEVTAFGSHLVRPRMRAQLAASISAMTSESSRARTRLSASAGLFLRDRVRQYTRELDGIARDLASPRVSVQPVSVARCHWLLTRAAESPLYNSRIPAEDLGFALRRIRSGMQPR